MEWHKETPKIGSKYLLIIDGELDDNIWKCQNTSGGNNMWITYIDNKHYTTGYLEVKAWISLSELEDSYYNQLKHEKERS